MLPIVLLLVVSYSITISVSYDIRSITKIDEWLDVAERYRQRFSDLLTVSIDNNNTTSTIIVAKDITIITNSNITTEASVITYSISNNSNDSS